MSADTPASASASAASAQQQTESKGAATAAPATGAAFAFVPPTLASTHGAAAAEAAAAPASSSSTSAIAAREGEEEDEAADAEEEAAAAAYSALLASTSGAEKVELGRKFLKEGNTDKAVDLLALALEDLYEHTRGAQRRRRARGSGGCLLNTVHSSPLPAVPFCARPAWLVMASSTCAVPLSIVRTVTRCCSTIRRTAACLAS